MADYEGRLVFEDEELVGVSVPLSESVILADELSVFVAEGCSEEDKET